MLAELRKALHRPDLAWRYACHGMRQALFWERDFANLPEPKVCGPVPHDRRIQEEVVARLKESGYEVQDYLLDVADYHAWREQAGYGKFTDYHGGGTAAGFIEKSLEHYVAARLLDLCAEDIYIDIASYSSPAPEIYRRLHGCRALRQDLQYPKGLRGDEIGGDAAHMPVPDGFATKLGLHCSFEHFEDDSDSGLIREAGRVLRPHGRMCIVPLYLFNTYAIQIDPAAAPRRWRPSEQDAILHGARGWRNRHGRFYDVPHLSSRVRDHLGPLRLTIYVVQNEKAVDPSCYMKFIALFERT
jgi:SAM-dependent methyltransferase